MNRLESDLRTSVKLNVGGLIFTTSLATLISAKDSLFENMFSGRQEVITDTEGNIFIDRDATHFRHILNYLRNGRLSVPSDFVSYNELLEEAQFYQIHSLVDQLSAYLHLYPSLNTHQHWINPSPNSCRMCNYTRDWDTNGVLYFIGTNEGTTFWSNPSLTGRVTVTSYPSNELCAGAHVANFIDRVGSTCWIPATNFKTIQNSWFCVDLGPKYLVVPSYYTLRDSTSGGEYQLRNWRLECSNDNNSWTTLRNHVNDTSMQNQGDSSSWPIPNCTNAFRYFRIIVTGQCAFPGSYFLFCSGFELYGTLYIAKNV